MRENITQRLSARFAAYQDLAEQLEEDLLHKKLELPKHKSLAEHLWCVIGARESYTHAIERGAWDGFTCSMQSFAPQDFSHKLSESADTALRTLDAVTEWTDERINLLATLAEHEVMHEGQIIRHMYALGKTLPDSWTWA
ncbi:MAG: hypothetical protein AAF541_12120 [Pseudomonadota bacterium]